jgi:hypothetical protein
MFNFFFREEREKLMAERSSGIGPLAEADRQSLAAGKDANTRKKELFALVGKMIAERWKQVTPSERERLKKLADDDMVRFNDEMSEYQINIARKKRVKEEAAGASRASSRKRPAIQPDNSTFPMRLHSTAGSPQAFSGAAARLGFSAEDQLQRDPSLRLPTPIEELILARRQRAIGQFEASLPNRAPNSGPVSLLSDRGTASSDVGDSTTMLSMGNRQFADVEPTRGMPGTASPGLYRRFGHGTDANPVAPTATIGSTGWGPGSGLASLPSLPSMDSIIGAAAGPDSHQELLRHLMQQERQRLLSGTSSAVMDPISPYGMGRQIENFQSATPWLPAGLGNLPLQSQRFRSDASSLLPSSSESARAQSLQLQQRHENDMISLLIQQRRQQEQLLVQQQRQQQLMQLGAERSPEGFFQRSLQLQEQQHQSLQQQQQQQQQLLQHQLLFQQQQRILLQQQEPPQNQDSLRRRDSDSTASNSDPYP